MAQTGITSYELATRTECSYEHIRKIVRCHSLPSKPLLKEICKITRIDSNEAQRLANIDFCRWKYGAAFWRIVRRRPENDTFYVLWYFLTEEQRENFMTQIKAVVRGRRGR